MVKRSLTDTSERALKAGRALVAASRQAVAFTGAGVSTPSGVRDFRSPGGIWTQYRPVEFDEFLRSEDARRRYWRYKKETYPEFASARPNAVHAALAGLEAEGRLQAVITQNIDGLHQEAGSQRVLELHGTNRRVDCLSCRRRYPASEVQDRLLGGCDVPRCDDCQGLLKPATVSFGQSLPAEVLAEAFSLARESDLVLILGSSLLVQPAASIPEEAAAAGVPMVIVNREATPLDAQARVVLHGSVEELLPALL
jgi:NAD-dependent deacetylase